MRTRKVTISRFEAVVMACWYRNDELTAEEIANEIGTSDHSDLTGQLTEPIKATIERLRQLGFLKLDDNRIGRMTLDGYLAVCQVAGHRRLPCYLDGPSVSVANSQISVGL